MELIDFYDVNKAIIHHPTHKSMKKLRMVYICFTNIFLCHFFPCSFPILGQVCGDHHQWRHVVPRCLPLQQDLGGAGACYELKKSLPKISKIQDIQIPKITKAIPG
jgi:hypothetical protein